jgi:predicted RNA-binding protein with RPS1 domain
MSWTRRINHPIELLNAGDEVEVVVLDINKDKQEISLGMKQTEVNPWTTVAQKYPPGTVVEGVVRNLTNYGAFIEIEEGIDGLLHISDMSWTKKVSHPSEMLKKGDNIRCVVLEVDQEKMRMALGLKQMMEDPWLRAVPERLPAGHGRAWQGHQDHELRRLRRARTGPRRPATRLRTGRPQGREPAGRSSRSATNSTSRSSASIRSSARSVCRRNGLIGPARKLALKAMPPNRAQTVGRVRNAAVVWAKKWVAASATSRCRVVRSNSAG